MSEAQPSQDIIRKIQALLNLGKRATNENEAALAMSRAQELLAKYNLDMAVIEATAADGGAAQPKEKREQTKIDHSAMYKWQRNLCRAMAEASFCFYWTLEDLEAEERVSNGRSYRHKVKRHVILGKESNVLAVKFMYGWLVDAIESLSPYQGPQRNSRSGISWKEGCAARLIERIRDKAYRMRQDETKVEGQAKSTGFMLRTFEQSEYELNYDAVCGAGAYAKAKQRQAEDEARRAQEPTKEKSPEEIEKQKKESERWWNKYNKQKEREASRRDPEAYRLGQQAGNDISLEDKLTSSKGA